jgi:hypothetical protein
MLQSELQSAPLMLQTEWYGNNEIEMKRNSHNIISNIDDNNNSVALVRERTIPSDRHLSAKLLPAFADRGVSRGQQFQTL